MTEGKNTPTLKPCNCGGIPSFEAERHSELEYVTCNECGASTPPFEFSWIESEQERQERMAQAWNESGATSNTRADDPATLRASNAELVALLKRVSGGGSDVSDTAIVIGGGAADLLDSIRAALSKTERNARDDEAELVKAYGEAAEMIAKRHGGRS